MSISRYIAISRYCDFASDIAIYCDFAIYYIVISRYIILRYRPITNPKLCMHAYIFTCRQMTLTKKLSAKFAIRGPVARTGANYDTRNSISFFSPFSQFFLSSRYHSFVPATVNLIGINFSPRISSSGKKAIPCKNYISV